LKAGASRQRANGHSNGRTKEMTMTADTRTTLRIHGMREIYQQMLAELADADESFDRHRSQQVDAELERIDRRYDAAIDEHLSAETENPGTITPESANRTR